MEPTRVGSDCVQNVRTEISIPAHKTNTFCAVRPRDFPRLMKVEVFLNHCMAYYRCLMYSVCSAFQRTSIVWFIAMRQQIHFKIFGQRA